jgi:hypothetical protein
MPTRIASENLDRENGLLSCRGNKGRNLAKKESGMKCVGLALITLYFVGLF